jgi:hypothetical protein
MHARLFIVCVMILLIGCNRSPTTTTEPATAASAATYDVIDLMPDFWAFWAAAEGKPLDEQKRLLKSMLVDRQPSIYAANVLTLDSDMPLDTALNERFERWLPLISPHIETMKKVSTRIASDLPEYEKSFRETFPDMSYSGKVYFMSSFGGFDGAVRTVNGERTLLFGVDMIAYVYGEHADPQPFFHHELFHIYHSQFLNEDDDRLFLSLWREGLATYVAKSLNPTAAGVNLFGLPLDTPQRAQAMLPQLVSELRESLDSTSPETYARFFFGKSAQAEVPARSGYYVGYLLAQKIGEGRQLRELARMQAPEIRTAIENGLRELEVSD